MTKRLVFGVSLLVAGVSAGFIAPTSAQQSSDLAVHEWGTFTSVAGAEGSAEPWRPLSGPSDLPCFIKMMTNNPKVLVGPDPLTELTALKATVRMETPVLYFYSPRAQDVRVRVGFPQGLITEWFPDAAVTPRVSPFDMKDAYGSIDWANVRVSPESAARFPTEPGKSHYYAARDTDAAPVVVGGQPEKFLFYRGMASFPVPLSVSYSEAGNVVVKNDGRHDLNNLVLFENRGERIGYRLASAKRGQVTIEPPVLTGSFDALRTDLEKMLVAQGLFAREAHAMVETWRDSWFEEGARLFYVLPQAAVDDVLPLEITPRPAQIARAFVGRIEIVSSSVQDAVAAAIQRNDFRTLDKYGRFLEPITARLLAKRAPGIDQARVSNVLRLIAASHVPEVTCR